MAGLVTVLAPGAADVLASYAMFMMINYLTDVWKLGFVQAAAAINAFWGLVSVLPLLLMFMSRSVGTRFVVVITNIAYSVGLVLLTMSTPPVLGNALGTCTEFELVCIGTSQRILFYIAVSLIALGMAGHKNYVQSFLPDQIVDDQTVQAPGAEGDDARLSLISDYCCSNLEMFIAKVVAVLVLPYFKSWSVRFGVPAAFTLLVTIFFLRGLPSYKFPRPEGSTWSGAEDTKKMVRMIPVCVTLLLCGVVSAIGWAFFAEQLGHMNPKVGSLTVSIGIILWFHEHTKDLFTQSTKRLEASLSVSGYASVYSLIGIAYSMATAILLCIIAALVEHRRLSVVQKHGIVDGIVPMTMFWLLPQFIFLGKFTGWYKAAAESFFRRRFPKATLGYLHLFVEALYGIGTLCSIGVVYLIGKISENGGNNWFQATLNASRLDKYFWTLAWLMAINFAVYIIASIWYSRKQPEDTADEELPESLAQQLLL